MTMIKNIKKYPYSYKYPNQHGAVVMFSVFIFLALSITVILGISIPISAQIRNSGSVLQTKKSLVAADVLNEEILYRLNWLKPLGTTVVLSMNEGTSSATISTVGTAKEVMANGIAGNFERNAKAVYTQGGGLSINYGLQVGNGGLQMSGGPTVFGSVYANGDIVASGGSTITGNAVAASLYELDADTQNDDGTTTPATFQTVGTASGVRTLAQSFTVSTTSPVTSFDFLVKKTGAPANATLRIYNNSGTTVGSTQIGGIGSLSANLVGTANYSWVKIYPYTPISLIPGTTYWVTIQYNGSATNYYSFGTNNNTFAGGAMKLKNNSGSYFDPSPSTLDANFRIFTGGVGTISGITINGFANAGIVNSSTVSGVIYCQSGTSNNKSCDTTQALPVPVPFPMTSSIIDAWKTAASAGTVRNSSWTISGATATTTSGPLKIVGDLTVTAGGSLTLNGPLYVTGTINVSGGAYIRLGASYGAGDEKIIGQYVRLTGGGQIQGNGTAGNYVIVVADGPDCPSGCSGSNYSLASSGGTGSVVLIAPNGTIEFSGGTTAKSAIAQKMIMSGGTTLVYEAGLTTLSFTTGSSTTWSVESWKEIE